MKVILLKDNPKIGRKDEVKEVSEGFARNFLFPRKLAILATEAELQKIAQAKEKKIKETSKEREAYQKTVEKLKDVTLEFKLKTGEKGKAFGSISEMDIQKALKGQGIEIEKEWIDSGHLKTTGEHEIKIKFPQGLEGKVKVKIEAENIKS